MSVISSLNESLDRAGVEFLPARKAPKMLELTRLEQKELKLLGEQYTFASTLLENAENLKPIIVGKIKQELLDENLEIEKVPLLSDALRQKITAILH